MQESNVKALHKLPAGKDFHLLGNGRLIKQDSPETDLSPTDDWDAETLLPNLKAQVILSVYCK